MGPEPDPLSRPATTEHKKVPVQKVIIYRADSSTNASSFSGDSGTSRASKRLYIEAEAGRKDIFSIFMFLLTFLLYLGVTGYGCYLAYNPKVEVSTLAYRIFHTARAHLPDLTLQILAICIVSGVLTFAAIVLISCFPKPIYQIFIIGGPVVYGSLAVYLYSKWKVALAPTILAALAIVHGLYLIVRRKHIRLYRMLTVEASAAGSAVERLFTPLLLWAAVMIVSGYSIVGAFGYFREYIQFYNNQADSTLYGFFFSVVVLGWLWSINGTKAVFRIVVTGLQVNDLLREGPVHESPQKLRPEMWRHAMTRFIGQGLLSSLLVSLGQCFLLLILFMKFEDFQDLIGYTLLLAVLQHVISIMFRQQGLVHCVMFGSSYFDGSTDVFIPVSLYDELCSHAFALIALSITAAASAACGHISTHYWKSSLDYETAVIYSIAGGFISLITSGVFYENLRTAVVCHIVAYGENPVVLTRTSPAFAEAVRVLIITENSSLIDSEP